MTWVEKPSDIGEERADRVQGVSHLDASHLGGIDPAGLDEQPLDYFARALRRLARRPGVDPKALVMHGHSRGGEAALLAGAAFPDLVHGVIALVPPYEAHGGWTLHSRPIEYATPLQPERVHGPILLAGGGRDGVRSSSFYTQQLEERLDDRGFPYRHERLDYPNADHSLAQAQPTLQRHILRFLRRLERR